MGYVVTPALPSFHVAEWWLTPTWRTSIFAHLKSSGSIHPMLRGDEAGLVVDVDPDGVAFMRIDRGKR
ncbi:hypothetical protein Tdes44962_MAKER05576 [Teratosphaeria destructans]|uniref:Uncharacterized protein n=1 Tax=Teratosphaeria destructans TaxID=418781 RepID=A0A9W7VYZ6_9PEZI|nr:hypothetical protein Tdes44962_MAKER05576 [Teratosphaeria destructans]